ncbi:MAG: LysM peptidoglycan-binding domain-containing protein [Anaerolineales bacterium]|nr:LysM peptidoglycan-binding domain-containing protein [Anaerolineales bacterium]
MVFRKRVFPLFVLLITAALLLAACERPTPGRDETATDADTAVTEETSDDVAASDTTAEETTEEAVTESSDSTEAAAEAEDAAADTADEATDDTVAETADSADSADDEADDSTTAEDEAAESAETEAADDAAAEDADTESANDEMSAERPSTHVVAKGENLFRIGLKYGMSWITLAQYNKIMNPHMVYVGQVIHIPPVYEPMQDKDAMHEDMSESAATESDQESTQEDSATEDEAETETESSADTTSSVATETTYQVHPGDNLFRIGLKYNVNWMQIAEANGIMNANYIKVGQTLKIPVSAPGPMPPFTHHVRYGETLFRISMQYGVKWTEIAAENEIKSPYIIYPGQMLQIPGK